jgi:uncharacterized protein YndB with AHSA1/START domain
MMPMERAHVASATTLIDAAPGEVWDALVSPDAIRVYMFGAQVTTDWEEGSPITWAGEWNGQPFTDQGEVVRSDRPRLLQYRHVSGGADPGDDHLVTVELQEQAGGTAVHLRQDNNGDEEAAQHSAATWAAMLKALKDYVERD